MQLQESREAKSAIIPAVGASGKLLVEEPAASSASAEEVEPNTQTGYGPVEAKAAVSATEGETPFEFGVEANYRSQNQVEDLELLQLYRLQWAASEKALAVKTAAAKALQEATPKQAKENAQSANSSATAPGEGKAPDISSSSSTAVKLKADANEQMKEDEIYAQTGEASVQAIAAASASEEGKIPAINAQTGKGPILPNAPVGAAAAASASVYSSAAGGDDNEVLGNTL